MNNLSKLIKAALIPLCAALVFSSCSYFEDAQSEISKSSAAEVQRSLDERKRNFSGKGYQCLTSREEQNAYAAIDIAVSNLQSERFEIKNSRVIRNFPHILEFYRNDNPQVFWIKDDVSYKYIDKGSSAEIELQYKTSGQKLLNQKKELESALDKILKKAPSNGTDYEKEIYINNYIVDHCEYDDEAAELHKEKKIRGNEQDVYGALVEGKAVCEGYARAFQLLCQRLNVECAVIEGYANEEDKKSGVMERTPHIWNSVNLDGEWYHTDVTWNDNTDEELKGVDSRRYYYFNITDTEILKKHEISPLYGSGFDSDLYNDFIPECTSDDYNYYKRTCPKLSSFDKPKDVVSALAKAAAKKKGYFDFIVSDDMNFASVKAMIAGTEGGKWIEEANKTNSDSYQLSDGCSLLAFEERRLVTFLLKYE